MSEQDQGQGRRPSNFRRMFSTKSTDVTVGQELKTEPLSTWLILVATFLVNVLIATADTVFGILYDPFTERYDAQRAEVGWVLSAFAASSSISSLLMSPFVVMYGCRPVGMAALFLLAFGTCLSAVAPNMPCLILFYGIVSGCGWGGIYLVTSTIVQQTFSLHRGLATGLAALGFTTGTVLSPILMDYLLTEFALQGALLLLSAAYAQGLVFAMILKTPKRLLQRGKKVEKSTERNSKGVVVEVKDVNGDSKSPDRAIGYEEQDKMLEKPAEGLPEELAASEEEDDAPKKQSFTLLLRNMLDFRVFRKVTFVLAIVYYLCFWMGRYITLSQGVGAAIHKGVPRKQAAYLLTIMGLCNLAIRLLSTLLLNCSWMNPVLYTSVGTLFLSAAGLFICWAETYVHFICAMVFLGFSEGLAVTVMPMVIVHILGVARFARAWSILWVGLLPGTMTAGPLSGWLVDITGSYMSAFIMTAVLGAVATVTALIIHVLQRVGARRKRKLKTGNSFVTKEITI